MQLRPYKFVVQAIVQQVDVVKQGDTVGEEPYAMAAVASERVVREIETETAVIYGADSLAEWAKNFPTKLAAAEAQQPE